MYRLCPNFESHAFPRQPSRSSPWYRRRGVPDQVPGSVGSPREQILILIMGGQSVVGNQCSCRGKGEDRGSYTQSFSSMWEARSVRRW